MYPTPTNSVLNNSTPPEQRRKDEGEYFRYLTGTPPVQSANDP